MARADAGALLPPVGEPTVPDADLIVAAQAVTSFFAELPEAIPLTPPEDGLPRAGNQFRNCGEPQCAHEYAQTLGVDFAVLVRLFAADRKDSRASVSVALVTSEGLAYVGNVEVDEAGVHRAVLLAVDHAYERFIRGPGPWLKVDGPDGARVRVDNGVPQALPYTEKYDPGLHRVKIDLPDGKVLLDTTVNLPNEPSHYEQILARDPNEGVASGELGSTSGGEKKSFWKRRPNLWKYALVGLPIFAVGTWAVANGAHHKRQSGQCVDEACFDEYKFDRTSKALLYGGITGMLVGAALPGFNIMFGHEDQARHAVVTFRGSF
jgi:hypothetical protein